jgi:hypothetical protein
MKQIYGFNYLESCGSTSMNMNMDVSRSWNFDYEACVSFCQSLLSLHINYDNEFNSLTCSPLIRPSLDG